MYGSLPVAVSAHHVRDYSGPKLSFKYFIIAQEAFLTLTRTFYMFNIQETSGST